MAKLLHSVEIVKTVNGEEQSKTFSLNGKEYTLYNALKEAKGDIVQVTKLISTLEMELSHLRVTKRNLSRLLQGWAVIDNLYGNGYSLKIQNT